MRDGKRHTSDIRLRACRKHTARHGVDCLATANTGNVGNTTGAQVAAKARLLRLL
jgi:hypothetical protein